MPPTKTPKYTPILFVLNKWKQFILRNNFIDVFERKKKIVYEAISIIYIIYKIKKKTR